MGFMNSGPRLLWVFPFFWADPPWWLKFDLGGHPASLRFIHNISHMFQKKSFMHKPATGARPQDCPAMTCANFKKHQLVKSVSLSKDPATYWNKKLVLENSRVFLEAFESLNSSISINTVPIHINIHIILWVHPVLTTGSSRTLWRWQDRGLTDHSKHPAAPCVVSPVQGWPPLAASRITPRAGCQNQQEDVNLFSNNHQIYQVDTVTLCTVLNLWPRMNKERW